MKPKSEETEDGTGTRTLSIAQWPISERPRERLLERGGEALSDAELLAVLIGHGCRGKSALDLAREIRAKAGEAGLRGLPEVARRTPGLGSARYARIAAAFELGRRAVSARLEPPARITTSRDAVTLLQPHLEGLTRERFVVLATDVKNRPLAVTEVARGGTEGVVVSPREVFGEALRLNASGVLCAHNHPSGDPTPSPEDRALTRRLRESARVLGVRFLDHIIFCDGAFFSFQDREGG